MKRSLLFAGALACAEPVAPAQPAASSAPNAAEGVTTIVHAPSELRYRSDVLGSELAEIAIDVVNGTDRVIDASAISVDARARFGATSMPCRLRDEHVGRASQWIAARTTATITRNLCSLPLVGDYTIDVTTAYAGVTASHPVALRVVPTHDVMPARVDASAFVVAIGGAPKQLRYTARDWQSGSFSVALRVTNVTPSIASVPAAQITFRVFKEHQPLSCTSTHAVDLPSALEGGASAFANVPVTCVIDVRGTFDIEPEIAFAGFAPLALGSFHVEVTSDPQIYLPYWER